MHVMDGRFLKAYVNHSDVKGRNMHAKKGKDQTALQFLGLLA